jgi:hypothetical protein
VAGLAVTAEEGRNKKIRPLRLIYDLRRAAGGIIVRAGVVAAVAMKVSGHRTCAVFDRYNIIEERDLRDVDGQDDGIRDKLADLARGRAARSTSGARARSSVRTSSARRGSSWRYRHRDDSTIAANSAAGVSCLVRDPDGPTWSPARRAPR